MCDPRMSHAVVWWEYAPVSNDIIDHHPCSIKPPRTMPRTHTRSSLTNTRHAHQTREREVRGLSEQLIALGRLVLSVFRRRLAHLARTWRRHDTREAAPPDRHHRRAAGKNDEGDRGQDEPRVVPHRAHAARSSWRRPCHPPTMSFSLKRTAPWPLRLRVHHAKVGRRSRSSGSSVALPRCCCCCNCGGGGGGGRRRRREC